MIYLTIFQPFNVNKFDVDIKNGGYTIKNSLKGNNLATTFEMKRADLFGGLIAGQFSLDISRFYRFLDVQQPYKTTLAGGQMKCEINRAFAIGATNNLSCDFNTDTAVETGEYDDLLTGNQ